MARYNTDPAFERAKAEFGPVPNSEEAIKKRISAVLNVIEKEFPELKKESPRQAVRLRLKRYFAAAGDRVGIDGFYLNRIAFSQVREVLACLGR